ncbi:MAG TPA: 2OG-Fe(II) oxygenase [Allosphingosinicella sp.]|jgi:prolyl 4-hydroxylase
MDLTDPLWANARRLIASGGKAEAILLVHRRAAGGDPSAWFVLACWKWEGAVLPRDLGQARALFARAGEAGHSGAAACITNLLANGVAGERDWPGALARLRSEARSDPQRQAASRLLGKMRLTPEGDPPAIRPSRPLSLAPEVHLFPGLFTPAECDHLARAAAPNLEPSFVVDEETGRAELDPVRTSDGCELHWFVEDPAVHALNRRLAAATGTSVDQGEPLQILRYSVGQQYRRHLDAVPGLANQRVLTAIVYLNQGYEGGGTCFPRVGLTVEGRKGDALVFRNASADGRVDPLSEHAGLPVTSGTKFIASRWIHQLPIAP